MGGASRLLRELFFEEASMSSGMSFHSMSGLLFWKDREDAGGGGRVAEDFGGLLVGAAGGGGDSIDVANAGMLTTAAVTLAGTAAGDSPLGAILSFPCAVPGLAANRFLTTHALPGLNLK